MGARQFLLHGLLAGLVAGSVAFGVASVVGEPAVEAAIALEEQAAAPSGGEHEHHHEGEPSPQHGHADEAHSHADTDEGHSHGDGAAITRATQAGLGLATGTLASGLVLGGLLGLVSATAMGRLGGLGPVASTALVGTVGAVAFTLVPFWKYPATPPAAGDPATIDERTATYFGFVAISVLAAVAATWLGCRLLRRSGGYVACASAVAGYAVVVGLAAAVLPAADVGDFPGQLLWEFRARALLVVVAMWGTLVLVTTGLVDRSWRALRAGEERRALKASL